MDRLSKIGQIKFGEELNNHENKIARQINDYYKNNLE